jgi:Plasma-membrane choline transporter
MRVAIQKSIRSVREAGAAVNHMLLVLLVPVLQAAGFVAFMAAFIAYSTYLASLGNITTQSIPLEYDDGTDGTKTIAVRVYEFNDFVKYCGWYLLFCLFWTANFIVAVGDMILALAVAHYYFTRDKLRIGSWTVMTSMWQVVLYHAGTCAFGALILSIVQIIRAIIARFQRAAKQTNNTLARIVLCCCQCCFCCLECCLKFMSKNAYIQTAIFSTSFCTSCRKAFFLIARNAARIAALSYVSAAVLIVGKLFISACTTCIAYYVITENLASQLYSVGGPVTVIFLISYWVSDFFMDIFDMAISTMVRFDTYSLGTNRLSKFGTL